MGRRARAQGDVTVFSQGQVRIRLLSVDDVDDAALDRYAPTLSAEELARAYHLKTEQLRTEFIASRGALREMLGEYLEEEPAAIIFAGGRNEKPSVIYPHTHLQFSLTHSAGKVVYAFAERRRVGVDIEAISSIKYDPALAAEVLSDAELHEWLALPHELKLRGFFCGWTRKEAFIKAVGKGLSLDLKSFSVTVDPRQTPELTLPPDVADEQWSLQALELFSGYEAAVVVEGTGYELVIDSPSKDSAHAASN